MPFLREDTYSMFTPSRLYGKQGEAVKIIKDTGDMLIVENKEGVKFPVLAKELVDYSNEQPQGPAKESPVPVNKRGRKKGPAPDLQPPLF